MLMSQRSTAWLSPGRNGDNMELPIPFLTNKSNQAIPWLPLLIQRVIFTSQLHRSTLMVQWWRCTWWSLPSNWMLIDLAGEKIPCCFWMVPGTTKVARFRVCFVLKAFQLYTLGHIHMMHPRLSCFLLSWRLDISIQTCCQPARGKWFLATLIP